MAPEYIAFFILGIFAGAVPMSFIAYRRGFMDGVRDEQDYPTEEGRP